MNPQSDEQTELLKEILKWIKFAGMKGVKDQLGATLDTDQKKATYQLSDGSKTIADISKITGVSAASISRYWQKWTKLALGQKIAVKGGDRFKRSFDLEDLGIEVPEATPKTVPEDNKKEPIEQKPEATQNE
jgi:hypothetical protein